MLIIYTGDDGKDRIKINNLTGDIEVFGMGGNDVIKVNDSEGTLFIDGGDGKDKITVDDFTGDITIESGDGNDKIQIDEGLGELFIDTGDGKDKITVDDFTGDITIESGDGNDKIRIDEGLGELFIDAGDGKDKITVDEFIGDITIESGDGNDKIRIDEGSGEVFINAGAGNDTVIISDFTGDVTVDGGAGNDDIKVKNVDGHIAIDGGSGHDSLKGGRGDDDLTGGADNDTISSGRGNDTVTHHVVLNLDTDDGWDSYNGGRGTDHFVLNFEGVSEAQFVDLFAVASTATGDTISTLADYESALEAEFLGHRKVDYRDFGLDVKLRKFETIEVLIPPQLDDATFNVNENTNFAGMLLVDDDDLPLPGLTYEIIAGNTVGFAIDMSSGEITHVGLNHEADDQHILTIKVTDSDGLMDTAIATINVLDVNEAPTIFSQTFDVDENVAGGTVVDTVTSADDVDDGDVLTYSITDGSGENVFDIDMNTGEITTKAMVVIDFETTPSYTLEVTVKDEDELSSSAIMTIDVNDDPNEFVIDAVDDPIVGPLPDGNDLVVGPNVLANDTITPSGPVLSAALVPGSVDASPSFTGVVDLFNEVSIKFNGLDLTNISFLQPSLPVSLGSLGLDAKTTNALSTGSLNLGAFVDLESDGTFTYNPGYAFVSLEDGESVDVDIFSYTASAVDAISDTAAVVSMTVEGTGVIITEPETEETSGNDLLLLDVLDRLPSKVFLGGEGDDVLVLSSQENIPSVGIIVIRGDADNDLILVGGVGVGSLFAMGGDGDDTLLLSRTVAPETTAKLFGDDGQDILMVLDSFAVDFVGGAGNDVLVGGAGNDTLNAIANDATDIDIFEGGGLADDFIFGLSSTPIGDLGTIYITDFSGSGGDGDRIVIGGIVTNPPITSPDSDGNITIMLSSGTEIVLLNHESFLFDVGVDVVA